MHVLVVERERALGGVAGWPGAPAVRAGTLPGGTHDAPGSWPGASRVGVVGQALSALDEELLLDESLDEVEVEDDEPPEVLDAPLPDVP